MLESVLPTLQAALGDIPPDIDLVFGHPALELKRFDPHLDVPFLAVRSLAFDIVPAGVT